ncbi:hypothetical protein C1Y43_19535 [Pantoea sp. ICBG 828]|uniref:hypothetical protein n=1 Tax=unclassified Pantoea TaxID=2630326 RepID=UPI000CE3197B|nr:MULTISPECIES: hypothetical protein [unclassified Pantoea]NIG36078.1 hypothetical protein [Pantoea sp. Ap-959]PPC65558.1 hypothetical protein C1Y43_19535 [Pantoea sp. ICBG 828]
MNFKLENQSVNVVWVAPVSPDLFVPTWFEKFELIREEDLKAAKVTTQESGITVDFGWLEIKATPHRVIFKLARAGLEPSFLDLISSTISLLVTTPTYAFGINTNYYYSFDTRENYDKLGDFIVPKDIWKEENKSKILKDDPTYHFGIRKLVMEIADVNSADNCIYDENINLTLTPRLNFEDVKYGLMAGFNHDYKVTKEKNQIEFTKLFVSILEKAFDNAVKNDVKTLESLFTRILS